MTDRPEDEIRWYQVRHADGYVEPAFYETAEENQ